MEVEKKIDNQIIVESGWSILGNQWSLFLQALFRPLIIIPVLIVAFFLYWSIFAEPPLDKRFSFILNIIAVLLTGLASKGIWDFVRERMGNTILIKKRQNRPSQIKYRPAEAFKCREKGRVAGTEKGRVFLERNRRCPLFFTGLTKAVAAISKKLN